MTLSPENPTASMSAISGILQGDIQMPTLRATAATDFVYDPTMDKPNEGFLVLGKFTRILPTSVESFLTYYRCSFSYGSLTTVNGGNPYDQMSTFRASTLSSTTGCTWVPTK
jgi:hypothetical protein